MTFRLPKLPKLRLPTLGELFALFHIPTSVSAIVAGVERQVEALEAAITHHGAQADAHRAAAFASNAAANASLAEMARAARVSGKLAALTA